MGTKAEKDCSVRISGILNFSCLSCYNGVKKKCTNLQYFGDFAYNIPLNIYRFFDYSFYLKCVWIGKENFTYDKFN